MFKVRVLLLKDEKVLKVKTLKMRRGWESALFFFDYLVQKMDWERY